MIDIGLVPQFEHTTKEGLPDRPRHGHQHVRAPARDGLRDRPYAHRPILMEADDIPSIEASAVLSPTMLPFTCRRTSTRSSRIRAVPGDRRGRIGRREAGHQRAALVDADGNPIIGETPEVRPLVGRGDLDQGSARHRQGRR